MGISSKLLLFDGGENQGKKRNICVYVVIYFLSTPEVHAMEIRYKIWLEEKGLPVLGDGAALLLEKIDQLGSIKQAAASMSMSYRQAWGTLKKAEERLGMALLQKQVGGESGGGASLTEDAYDLLAKYKRFRAELDDAVHEIFRQYFE
jgi:molybdate transport system regulatory protein